MSGHICPDCGKEVDDPVVGCDCELEERRKVWESYV